MRFLAFSCVEFPLYLQSPPVLVRSVHRLDDSTQAPHLAVPFLPKALLLKTEETGPWKNVEKSGETWRNGIPMMLSCRGSALAREDWRTLIWWYHGIIIVAGGFKYFLFVLTCSDWILLPHGSRLLPYSKRLEAAYNVGGSQSKWPLKQVLSLRPKYVCDCFGLRPRWNNCLTIPGGSWFAMISKPFGSLRIPSAKH